MREYRYTTPHGIQVTRTVSKANFRKGLQHLLRDLDRHRGIYLSSGYEFPGRYSRWDIAATRPPLEIVSYDRRVEFRPLNARGRASCACSIPFSRSIRIGNRLASKASMLAGPSQTARPSFREEERSKQPSVFSILRALIEEFRGEEDGRLGLCRRVRLRSALPVRADREKAAARRPQRPSPVPLRRHLFHGPQERADRALSVRVRARGLTTWRSTRAGAEVPSRRRSANPAPSSPTIRRKNTGQRRARARRHAPRRLLRGSAAPDLPHAVLRQGLGPVRARAARQPQPVRIPAAVR